MALQNDGIDPKLQKEHLKTLSTAAARCDSCFSMWCIKILLTYMGAPWTSAPTVSVPCNKNGTGINGKLYMLLSPWTGIEAQYCIGAYWALSPTLYPQQNESLS